MLYSEKVVTCMWARSSEKGSGASFCALRYHLQDRGLNSWQPAPAYYKPRNLRRRALGNLNDANQPSQAMACSLPPLLSGFNIGIHLFASRAFKQWAAGSATEEARNLSPEGRSLRGTTDWPCSTTLRQFRR